MGSAAACLLEGFGQGEAAVGTAGYFELQAMMAAAPSSQTHPIVLWLESSWACIFNQLQPIWLIGPCNFFVQQQVPDNPFATLFVRAPVLAHLTDVQCVTV